MNNTNNASARMSFDVARKLLFNSWIKSFGGDAKACWEWVNGRKLSQQELRLEVNLTTGNSIWTFAVTKLQQNSTGVIFPTEERLNPQDSLISNEYAIQIAQTTGNADADYITRTYPNTQDFAAADVTALNGTFYSNGGFTMKVNNDVVLPYRPLRNHLYRGQTQQTAALGAGSPQDQYRGAEDSFVTNVPNILLIGTKNYIPQIILKGPITLTNANIRAILIFQGVLAQNSTSIN